MSPCDSTIHTLNGPQNTHRPASRQPLRILESDPERNVEIRFTLPKKRINHGRRYSNLLSSQHAIETDRHGANPVYCYSQCLCLMQICILSPIFAPKFGPYHSYSPRALTSDLLTHFVATMTLILDHQTLAKLSEIPGTPCS